MAAATGAIEEDKHRLGRRRRFRVAVAAGAAAAGLLVPTTAQAPSHLWENLALVLLAAAVTGAAWATSRTSGGRRRLAWRTIALAGAIRVAFEIFHLAAGDVAGVHDAGEAVSDTLAIAAAAVLVVALRGFFPRSDLRSERVRNLLVALTVALSFAFLQRLAIGPKLLEETGSAFTANLLHTALLSLAIVLVSLGVILYAMVGRGARLTVGLLAGAFVFGSYAAATHGLSSALGTAPRDSYLGTASALAYILLALAALSPAADVENPRALRHSPRESGLAGAGAMLPTVAAAAAAAWSGAVPGDGVLAAIGLCILLLSLTRFYLLSRDTAELLAANLRVEALEEASTALAAQATKSRRMVEAFADGVLGVDLQGRICAVNPRAARLLGKEAAMLTGRPFESLLHRSEGTPEPDPVRSALASGRPTQTSIWSFVRSDGVVFPVDMAVGPVVENAGTTGAVVVFRDITERKAVERMKDEFVSVVSHELRTPLTAIRGALGLLGSGRVEQLSEPSRKLVTLALDNSVRLGRIVDDLLDIERLESGGAPLEFADHRIDDLIRTAIAGISPLAARVPVNISAHPAVGRVHADGDRIVQALTNLLGNAVKFSPAGSTITVSVSRYCDAIEIAVTDQGRGIPQDKLESIFERFEQVDSSDTRDKGGTGLGLSICRTIARRHGGSIRVESQPGHGSTFTLTLPVARKAEPTTSAAEATRAPAPEPTGAPATEGTSAPGPEAISAPAPEAAGVGRS